jgi:vacuolar protein sorting-associated protein 41
MTRIAHVDRPSGARAALYPTISDLKPTLCFETSSNLLVAWGDCVMAMTVQESIVRTSNDDTTPVSAANSRPASDQTVLKRRHVGCTMAWELDCVACGIAPLDQNHLLILGLVANDESDRSPGDPLNDVELQVISRSEGTVIYADVIPVVRWHDQGVSVTRDFTNESASVYSLLSSFSVPRMEDTMEADAEGVSVDKDFDFTLFSNTANKPFVDMHLRWNLDALDFDGKSVDDAPADEDKADDDSEDYGFLFRQASNAENVPKWSGSIPPVLMVTAPSDLVTIRTRTIDDAISHALYRNKPALALKRALRYKRQLREYDIHELVDAYLKAILCIDEGDESQRKQRLSIHRLELATKSTPILLGGNAQRWQYWTEKFSCIPGALFVLWDHLPVRGKLTTDETNEFHVHLILIII